MPIINIVLCLVQCALHLAWKLLKCFKAYTISNDCFCFSVLKIFAIGFKSGVAILLESIRQQVAKLVETLHPIGALLIYLLSPTLQPPSPLSARKKNYKILRKCQGKFYCLVFEMLSIKKFKPYLNVQTDSIRAKHFVNYSYYSLTTFGLLQHSSVSN